MFDLKYYATLNEIRNHTDNINDYNKFKGSIKNKDDYLNVYQDFFNKNCIDANTYSTLRLYLILSDMYFSDYDTDVVDKKYAYYKKSIWNGRQNRQLTDAKDKQVLDYETEKIIKDKYKTNPAFRKKLDALIDEWDEKS